MDSTSKKLERTANPRYYTLDRTDCALVGPFKFGLQCQPSWINI